MGQLEALHKVSEMGHTDFVPMLSDVSDVESLGGGRNPSIFGSGYIQACG